MANWLQMCAFVLAFAAVCPRIDCRPHTQPDTAARQQAAALRPRHRRRVLALISVVIVSVGGLPATAFAYNGGAAASWADQWALSVEPYGVPTFSDDCTNFVSMSLHYGGGYPERQGSNIGPTSNDTYWYMAVVGIWVWSNSWTVAQDQYNFQHWKIPGGTNEGSVNAGSNGSNFEYPYTPNSVVTGDEIFYDWNSDGHLDHMSIQVGIGKDPTSGWSGNYVDQHTTNRFHAFWSLFPYNTQWQTTTITFEHIWSTN